MGNELSPDSQKKRFSNPIFQKNTLITNTLKEHRHRYLNQMVKNISYNI